MTGIVQCRSCVQIYNPSCGVWCGAEYVCKRVFILAVYSLSTVCLQFVYSLSTVCLHWINGYIIKYVTVYVETIYSNGKARFNFSVLKSARILGFYKPFIVMVNGIYVLGFWSEQRIFPVTWRFATLRNGFIRSKPIPLTGWLHGFLGRKPKKLQALLSRMGLLGVNPFR